MSDDGRVRDVTAADMGVVCAHVSQVNAVASASGPVCRTASAETVNRFQGIERPFMFVHHPLSGRADATAFHLDAGRLCDAVTPPDRLLDFRTPGDNRATICFIPAATAPFLRN